MIFLIKKNIKRSIASVLSAVSSPPSGVNILMYHSIGGRPSDHRLAIRVPVANFLAHIDELKRWGYVTLTVSELIEPGVLNGNKKVIAITFDDGYKDNITDAARVLKANEMKATFFVTTSNIDGNSTKRWSNGIPREYMDWDDVAKLNGMGFEIGSHMIDHVDLTTLDEKELRYQFEFSKKKIRDRIGVSPATFSYPYGGLNEKVVIIAKETGYIAGCSSFKGLNNDKTARFILKRTEIDGYDIINDLRLKLYGY